MSLLHEAKMHQDENLFKGQLITCRQDIEVALTSRGTLVCVGRFRTYCVIQACVSPEVRFGYRSELQLP